MNALSRSASMMPRAATLMAGRSSRTLASSAPVSPGKSTFKSDWLSDPSTYPIIIVLSFAVVMSASFITYKVTCCNDVRISSKAKGHVVRTWA